MSVDNLGRGLSTWPRWRCSASATAASTTPTCSSATRHRDAPGLVAAEHVGVAESAVAEAERRQIRVCGYLMRYHEERGDKIIVFSDSVYCLQK